MTSCRSSHFIRAARCFLSYVLNFGVPFSDVKSAKSDGGIKLVQKLALRAFRINGEVAFDIDEHCVALGGRIRFPMR